MVLGPSGEVTLSEKRIRAAVFVCSVIVIVVGLGAGTLLAKSGTRSISVSYRNIKVMLQGKQVSTTEEPFIYEGRVYVPLRLLSEQMGQKVTWNSATNTVSISAATVSPVLPIAPSSEWETVTITADVDNGDAVIVRRRNGDEWLLEAKTWCSWSWRYEGRNVLLKFGYVSSILVNDDGDSCDFWTKDEVGN
jgi:hypothetical protein